MMDSLTITEKQSSNKSPEKNNANRINMQATEAPQAISCEKEYKKKERKGGKGIQDRRLDRSSPIRW